MGGRYGFTMPKKRGKRTTKAPKQVPAMKFLGRVGKGTLWAAHEIGEAIVGKPKNHETMGSRDDNPPSHSDPVL